MNNNIKHIVGAGKGKIKKRPPRKMKPIKPKTPRPIQPKPKYPGNPDSNGFIGAGLTGLGQQELQRRIKQHNALAQKAFQAAGGGKKETLTAADVANVYRGLNFQNRAKVMQTMADYEKIGKTYYKKKK